MVNHKLDTDKTEEKQMRHFDTMVFMGAGSQTGSDCYLLHTLLDKALGNLSVLQQGMTGDRADSIEYEIEEAVKDICAALLGKKLILGKKLPYPGKINRVR